MALLNYNGKGAIRVGSFKIRAARWPWQAGYNWRGMTNSSAPLNAGGARFGGGWDYQLGVSIGSKTVNLNLLFGMVSFSIETDLDRKVAAKFRAWQERQRAEYTALPVVEPF